MARLRRILDHPKLPWLVALLGFVLTLPGITTGFQADDLIHRLIVLGGGSFEASSNPVLELFSFVGETAPLADRWVELGLGPWWQSPDLRIAFLRPLSAATQVLDLLAWPDVPVLHHVHSGLWYGVVVLVVALVFRKVHGPTRTAGLAALLFAVEDAHALPAVWIANRNALVALAFGGLGLLFHLRWRAQRRPVDLVLAMAGIGLGLAGGEAALGVLAYVAAWQLAADRGSWRERLLGLVPYAVPVAAWALTYRTLGYGVHDSGLYLDPTHHPGRFALAMIERAPLLLAGQWLQLPVDVWVFLPRATQLTAPPLRLIS